MNKEIVIEGERRWSKGSWIALGYALFIFVINAVVSIYSFNLPGDGWYGDLFLTSGSPVFIFKKTIVDAVTPILTDDQLLVVNGKALEKILDEQYAFYDMQPPDWPGRKYDSARALETFAASARNETNVQRLTANLVSAVQDSLEPGSVGLWITPWSMHDRRSVDIAKN